MVNFLTVGDSLHLAAGIFNCPKAVRCYQFREERFAEPKQIGGAGWQLECLEINPLECSLAQFSEAAASYICNRAVRTYVVGKVKAGEP